MLKSKTLDPWQKLIRLVLSETDLIYLVKQPFSVKETLQTERDVRLITSDWLVSHPTFTTHCTLTGISLVMSSIDWTKKLTNVHKRSNGNVNMLCNKWVGCSCWSKQEGKSRLVWVKVWEKSLFYVSLKVPQWSFTVSLVLVYTLNFPHSPQPVLSIMLL